MTESYGWRFPTLDGAEREGINDPVIKAFAGDHEKFIARECIQNSVDHQLDKNKPVKVEFRLKSYPRSTFPNIDELTGIVDRCVQGSAGQQAKDELTSIREQISADRISTLLVRDFNTEGLNGEDDDERGSWHRLVRAVGSNAPSGVGGGAYGLGKGAPFAASGIRTVFYSTLNDKSQQVFQGKTRLISHLGEDGDMKRGVGLYGVRSANSCASIRDSANVPAEFARSERGTDIIIPAYKAVNEDWQLGLIHSVLKNFWPAIHEGMLEVEIYDGDVLKELINAENLSTFLEVYPGEETGYAYFFYLAKTSPDKDGYFSEQLDGLGEVELYVKRGEGYPKKVQQMRAPLMVVSDETYRRSLLDPYAAVLICKDEDGNNFLKGLEPPQHDKWDPSLGRDIRESKRIYKSLQDWVRSKLKSLSQASEGEMAEIPGLAEYLASMERDDHMPFGRIDRTNEPPEDETAAERIVPTTLTEPAEKPVAYSFAAKKADPGPDKGRGGGAGGSGGARGTGSGSPNPSGHTRNPLRSPIRVRNLGMTRSGDSVDLELCLYSTEPFIGAIKLLAAGEDMNSGIKVIQAHAANDGVAYQIKGGRILNVKIEPARPARILAKLNGTKMKYALGVESYENAS